MYGVCVCLRMLVSGWCVCVCTLLAMVQAAALALGVDAFFDSSPGLFGILKILSGLKDLQTRITIASGFHEVGRICSYMCT